MQDDLRACAPVPFWFWNGDQDPQRICEQLDLVHRWGLQGLAIHARVGNQTPYLGEAWFALVRSACAHAAGLGLRLWIYDECDYPSGTVGQRIPREEPDLRQANLVWRRQAAGSVDPSAVLGCFTISDGQACDPTTVAADQPLLVFAVERLERYVDVLNPQTGARFLALTHERYQAAVGAYFGSVISAVFTDDITYHLPDRPGLGWTDDLPAVYQERYDDDLLLRLPQLVGDYPGAAATRARFHRLLGELFRERWMDPQRRWCEANDLCYTGHLRGDEGPCSSLARLVGNAPAVLAGFTMPGIDDFLLRMRDGAYTRRALSDYGCSPAVLYRLVASAADQWHDGRCMSEAGASMGWAVHPAEARRQIRFEQMMGINTLAHHSFDVATAGIAKRDHPPSWGPQLPWRAVLPAWYEEQTRLCAWLRSSRSACRTVVCYPTETIWQQLRGADLLPIDGLPMADNGAAQIEADLAELALALVRGQVPFHFTDADQLAAATVVDGGLRIGAMIYDQVVLLTPIDNPAARERLAAVLAAGGRVEDLVGQGIGRPQPTIAALAAACEPAFDLGPAADGLVVDERIDAEGRRQWIIANCSDHDQPLAPRLAAGCWQLRDASDDALLWRGQELPADCRLPPDACCRIEMGTGAALDQLAARGWRGAADARRLTIDGWQVSLAGENLLLVDRVVTADGRWCRLCDCRPEEGPFRLSLQVPAGVQVTALYAEQVGPVMATWDDQPLGADGHHPASPDLRRLPVSAGAAGEHQLCLQVDPAVERIEDCYLACDGAVVPISTPIGWTAAVRPWDPQASIGDQSRERVPFAWDGLCYAASVSIDDPAQWTWLDCGRIAHAAAVSVNGVELGKVFGPPWRLPLGDSLRQGINHVSITVWGSAQNCFGPQRVVDDAVWAPREDDRQPPDDPYHLAPVGLLATVALCAACPLRQASAMVEPATTAG